MTTQKQSEQFLLKAVNGEQQLPIDRELKLGRDPGSDVVLDQGGASRRHAILKPSAEGVWVEDSGSTNGTFVNGERIEQARLLKAGDLLQVGNASFKLIAPTPAADPDATLLHSAEPDPDATLLHSVGHEPKAAPAASPSAKQAPAAPPAQKKAAAQAATKKAPAKPKTEASDSKAPPSWVLDNQQSVDGTAFISKDLLQDSLRNSENFSTPQTVGEPTLIGNSDPVLGLRFQLIGKNKHQWEIGRSPNADVMLNHESVSGAHAQIIHDAGRWKLVDLMSANGTYANGKKCLTGYLSSGDIVCFGSVECAFMLPKTKQKAAPEPEPEPVVIRTSPVKTAALAFGLSAAVVSLALFIISRFL